MPSTNISADRRQPASIALPVVRSGNVRPLLIQRPVKDTLQNREDENAVMSKPITESAAAQVASGKTPLKIRNSPMNPFSPGKPSEENSAMPISPQNTGATLRKPPKSFNPRNPRSAARRSR